MVPTAYGVSRPIQQHPSWEGNFYIEQIVVSGSSDLSYIWTREGCWSSAPPMSRTLRPLSTRCLGFCPRLSLQITGEPEVPRSSCISLPLTIDQTGMGIAMPQVFVSCLEVRGITSNSQAPPLGLCWETLLGLCWDCILNGLLSFPWHSHSLTQFLLRVLPS